MSKLPNGYKITVGIECHVQLKTRSKLFSGADNDSRHAEPNTLVNHIDMGLPGALPVLNKQAVYLASKTAFALGSKPQKFSKFDRKHYFYPDLPMGYQISQFDEPIVLGGSVTFVNEDGEEKTVNITRAHLEADAGKSIHPDNSKYSFVDLNRAGTPLLEIVSEPEIHTAKDAKAYCLELYLLMKYADVSEANLFYGNMRFDVNVSVSKNDELGTRAEVKNLNSFKAVEKAVEYEALRQVELLESGERIVQETRGWNDAKDQTYSLRSKENAEDYRYMPDPDIPPVVLDDEYIDDIKKSMPKMPNYWREKLKKLNINTSFIETLILTEVEFDAINLDFMAGLTEPEAKSIANWIVNIEVPLRNKLETTSSTIILSNEDRHKAYKEVAVLVNEGKLSSTNAKELIGNLLEMSEIKEQIEDIADQKGLIQNSNNEELEVIVRSVLDANPKAVEDLKNGELKVIGFLVGQVMKESKGKANPGLVNNIIKELIK